MTDLQLGVLLLNVVRQMNLAFDRPEDERLIELAGLRDLLEAQASQLGVDWGYQAAPLWTKESGK
jgi:hypothetical protein